MSLQQAGDQERKDCCGEGLSPDSPKLQRVSVDITSGTYEVRLAECLRVGHRPTEWHGAMWRRALCMNCGHTWPIGLMRLLSMPGIEPINTAPAGTGA